MAETGWFFIYGKRLRRKLRDNGATQENTAKTADELGLNNREIRTLKRNVFLRKVKEITDEKNEKRYYLVDSSD